MTTIAYPHDLKDQSFSLDLPIFILPLAYLFRFALRSYLKSLEISVVNRNLAPDVSSIPSIYLGWSSGTLAPSIHTRKGNFLYLTYINLKHSFLQYVVDLPKESKLPFHKFNSSREVSQEIKRGHSVMTLADGPFGPSGVLNLGPVGIARRIGCPIITIKSEAKIALRLPFRWDKYKIPLPFSEVKISYSKIDAKGKSCEELKNILISSLGES